MGQSLSGGEDGGDEVEHGRKVDLPQLDLDMALYHGQAENRLV